MEDDKSKKNRRFLQGAAVLVASLLGSLNVANSNVANSKASVAPTVSTGNGQVQPDFVIAPAQAAGAEQLDHTSHSSHSSHNSHSSHSSHVSSSI